MFLNANCKVLYIFNKVCHVNFCIEEPYFYDYLTKQYIWPFLSINIRFFLYNFVFHLESYVVYALFIVFGVIISVVELSVDAAYFYLLWSSLFLLLICINFQKSN